MRRADIAMYASKYDKSGVTIYESHLDSHRADQLSLLGDLRKAMTDNQLTLNYQPKVDLRNSQVVGVEALVRWQHPVRGVMPPSEFIPFAEQTGMIRQVTRWVIEESMRQCGVWLASDFSLGVSVNVSSRDLLVYLAERPARHAELVRRRPEGPLEVTHKRGGHGPADRFDYLMISKENINKAALLKALSFT